MIGYHLRGKILNQGFDKPGKPGKPGIVREINFWSGNHGNVREIFQSQGKNFIIIKKWKIRKLIPLYECLKNLVISFRAQLDFTATAVWRHFTVYVQKDGHERHMHRSMAVFPRLLCGVS